VTFTIHEATGTSHHQAMFTNQKVMEINHHTNRRSKKGKTVISASRGRARQKIDGVIGAISLNAYETIEGQIQKMQR
jgi:hypothetical protein